MRMRKRAALPSIAFALGVLTHAAAVQAAAPPLKVCLVSGSAQYRSAESLAWLQEHLEERYSVKCFRAFGEDQGTDLPGVEALDECDLVVVFTRRMILPADQLDRIKRFCDSGKGIVGIRTASHAFQNWLEFDPLVLGGSYSGHYGSATVPLSFAPGAEGHPVLKSVKAFGASGGLYRNPKLAADAEVLLAAASGDRMEPVAWVRTRKGRRVFYTSLGTPEDFRDESFRRMVVNAVFWVAGREHVPPAAPAPGKEEGAGVFEKIAGYRYGGDRTVLVEAAGRVREAAGDAERRKDVATRLAAILNSDSAPEGKRFVCRQLRLIGSDESVPALAALLADEELCHYARYALEQMQTPAAGAALRDAVGRVRGKLLAGVIGSLGERGDAGAVPALVELVRDRDETVAAAAVAALGDIGGWGAARALAGRRKDVQDALVPVVTDAQLKCAEWMLARGNPWEAAEIYRGLLETTAPEVVRAAGLGGMLLARGPGAVPLVIEFLKGDDRAMAVTAARLAGAVPGEAVTRAMAAELSKLAPAVQVTLLGVLEARGDPAARTAVVAATKSPEEPVRVAALAALGRLGDASTVPLLAGVAAAGPESERKAAARSLDRLRGAGVTDAMVAEIGRAEASGQRRRPDRAEASGQRRRPDRAEPGTRRVLVRSLAARGAVDAVPALVEAAEDADESVRRESIKALGALGEPEVLPFLLDLLTETRDKSERREAEKAVGAVCARSEGKSECSRLLVASYPRAATEARCAILRLTAAVGGTEALSLVRRTVGDRDAEIGKAAVRALANWPDPAPTDDLLEMARTSPDETHRVLALRGYVAMVERGRRKPEEKLGMLETAMDLARRPEERKLVLKGAAAVRTADGLSFIARHLDDENLRMEAAGALVAMARDDRFRKANRRDLKSALEKARGFVADKRLAGEIKKHLGRIGR